MLRRARTRLSGKRVRREGARAAGRRYSRLAPGSLERVCRAPAGCRATRGSAWRREFQAVPAGRVSGRDLSNGHFRLVTPPTCWSSGAPVHWPLLDGPGVHGGVGGGHWGGDDAGCGAPPGGAAISAILAGPRALALSGASAVVSAPGRRCASPSRYPAVTRSWQSGRSSVTRRAGGRAEAGRLLSQLLLRSTCLHARSPLLQDPWAPAATRAALWTPKFGTGPGRIKQVPRRSHPPRSRRPRAERFRISFRTRDVENFVRKYASLWLVTRVCIYTFISAICSLSR